MPSLTTSTAEILERMLKRLPPSLWDTDPQSETLQRDLYRAFAAQMAIFIENRSIASTMTLLLQAQGVDLDVLLEDYGLRRYLQRPDAYARQVGMHILWHPKGTLDCIRILADLLFDQTHLTLRTGRSEQHVFVADTQPVTSPYSYWGMVSADALWYAVTVESGLPMISQMPPPGIDVAPGPHKLHWFTVLDDLSQTWYVTIAGDTLTISQTQPLSPGTTTVFEVQDGAGVRWQLTVASQEEALMPVAVSTGNPILTLLSPGYPFQALNLVDRMGHLWWLWIQSQHVTMTSTQPADSLNATPAGGPYQWLRLYDQEQALWYAYPSTGGVLQVSQTSPGGRGTATPQALGDQQGVLWHYGITPTGTLGVSSAPAVTTQGHATTMCLNDGTGARWFWRVHRGLLQWSAHLWPNSIDQSPWGEIGWVRIPIPNGAIYAYPSPTGAPMGDIAPPIGSPWGWREPVFFLDELDQRWQLTATQLSAGHPDYWRMIDNVGTPYYVWMEPEIPTIGLSPPPGGVDYTPSDDPLSWFLAFDARHQRWFVSIAGDTLVVSLTVPPGIGADTPAILADTQPILWTLTVSLTEQALVATQTSQTGITTGLFSAPYLETGAIAPVVTTQLPEVTPLTTTLPSAAEYWVLYDSAGVGAALWIEGEVVTLTYDFSGGVNTTPSTSPLTWVSLQDDTGATWYLATSGDTLSVTTTAPSGAGTSTALILHDADGQAWAVTVSSGEEALLSSPTTVTTPPPSTPPSTTIPTNADYWVLYDSTGTGAALWIEGEVLTLTYDYSGGSNQTPSLSPLTWVSLQDETGATWYLATSGDTLTVSGAAPSGAGTSTALTLHDASGQVWYVTVSSGEEALLSSTSTSTPPTTPPPTIPTNADYWRLVDDQGTTYALFMEAEVPTLTTSITGGHETTPGGAPLPWFVAADQNNTTWYVSVQGDTLQAALTASSGTGTYQAAHLADSTGAVWTLTMDAPEEALVATPPVGGGPGPGAGPDPPVPGSADYWRMRDSAGVLYAFYMDAEVPSLTTTISGGSDHTPGGTPVVWFTVVDEVNTTWYVTVHGDTFFLQTTIPSGLGTYQPAVLTDAAGTMWNLTAYNTGQALVSNVGPGAGGPGDGGGIPLAATWRISVQLVPSSEQIPGLTPALNLHEAVDAFTHIQAAGSLLSIVVS